MPETLAGPCPSRLQAALTALMAVHERLTVQVRAGQVAWVAAVPSWRCAQVLLGKGWACAGQERLP